MYFRIKTDFGGFKDLRVFDEKLFLFHFEKIHLEKIGITDVEFCCSK
jgi:hypothetical protein